MTVDEMLPGEWKLLIDEAPADLAMNVTFDGGVVRDNGLDVGTYRIDGSSLLLAIGTDLTVAVTLPDLSPLLPGIDEVKPNVLQAVATTEIPEGAGLPEMDGENLIEPAVLTRVSSERITPPEVFERLRTIQGGKALANVLQGAWDVRIDDQPEDQADRLVIDGDAVTWNGMPAVLAFDGDEAMIDLGAYKYQIKRYYADASRTDRFDASMIVGPGEAIFGQMDRVRVGNTGPRTDMRSAG